MHAVLHRQYTKGRDLYDFLWYRGKKTAVNITLLENGIQQTQGEQIHLTAEALQNRLTERFEKIDFETARNDVERFLENPESLSLFTKEIFMEAVAGLEFAK